MKRKGWLVLLSSFWAVSVVAVLVIVLRVSAQERAPRNSAGIEATNASFGTAFTYQGQLKHAGSAVNGPVAFQFELFDALESGNQAGPTITMTILVTNGLFTADLDFGAVFTTGTAYYLQVGVTTEAAETSPPYTLLSPRQQITPSPYAIYSQNVPWDGIKGVPEGFDDDFDNDTLGSMPCETGQIAKRHGSAWICSDSDSATVQGGGDCNAIQQAINTLPATGGQVIISADTYTCTTSIVIDRDNVDLRGQGPATVLYLADAANAPVLVLGQTSTPPTVMNRHIQVLDLTINGNRANQTFECWGGPCGTGEMTDIRNNGITLRRVSDVVIERVTVSGARSGGLVTEKGCRRLAIHNFTAFDNHFDGLAGYETENSIFSELYLHDNVAAGFSFDIDFNHNIISDVVIDNSGSVGIFMRDSRDNIFHGLQIRNSAQHGIFLAEDDQIANTPAYGNIFDAINISNSGGAGIRVNDVSCAYNVVSSAQLVGNSGGCISEVTSGLVISDTVVCR